jgi:hypothetical protein
MYNKLPVLVIEMQQIFLKWHHDSCTPKSIKQHENIILLTNLTIFFRTSQPFRSTLTSSESEIEYIHLKSETKPILKLAPSFDFTILLLCYPLVNLSILYQIKEMFFQTLTMWWS